MDGVQKCFLGCVFLFFFLEKVSFAQTGLCANDSTNKSSHLCQEYLKMTNSSLLSGCSKHDEDRLTCKRRCDESSQRKLRERLCYCDSKCSFIGDCCIDYSLWCNTTIMEEFNCLANQRSSFQGYVIKTGCPYDWQNNTVKQLCFNRTLDNLKSVIPVFDQDTRVTFSNVYCAICNGAKTYTYWKIKALLEIPADLQEAPHRYNILDFTMKERRWWAEPNPAGSEEYCVPTTLKLPSDVQKNTTNNVSDLWSSCTSYAMPVYRSSDDRKFKNPHCGQLFSTVLADFRCSLDNRSEELIVREESPEISDVSVVKVLDLRPEIHVRDDNANNLIIKKDHINGTVCEQQIIYSSEKHVIHHKVIILAPSKTRIHNRYNNIKSVILVCGNFTLEFVSSDNSISAILTVFGFSISIISILFFLLTHILFRELCSLHGKNLISLSCAMLTFESLFLASGETSVRAVCDVITGVLHYTLLAMFSWMSVVGYDVTRAFVSKSAICAKVTKDQEQKKKMKRFFWYSFYAWGTPLILVILGVVLDFSKALETGYGLDYNRQLCYLSFNGRVYLTAIPIGAVLLFNIVTLVRTVTAIGKVQRVTKNFVQRKNQVSLAILCLKLTSVMGVTWVLFLVYNAIGNLFVEYLFTVINSLQGFFIVVFFGFTKRIRTLYRNKFKCLRSTAGNSKENSSQLTRSSRFSEESRN